MSQASPAARLRVGDLAARTGVNTRLLRYYETQGLLRASRSSTGQRLFGPEAVEQVLYIRQLLKAGLTTQIIRELMDCIREPGRIEPCAVPLLAEHLAVYDTRIAELMSTRIALQGLIEASRDELC